MRAIRPTRGGIGSPWFLPTVIVLALLALGFALLLARMYLDALMP